MTKNQFKALKEGDAVLDIPTGVIRTVVGPCPYCGLNWMMLNGSGCRQADQIERVSNDQKPNALTQAG